MFERFFQNSVVFWPGRKVGPGQHADGLRKGKGRKHKIYAVWPGNWSSDLFLIDDLDAFTEKWELV